MPVLSIRCSAHDLDQIRERAKAEGLTPSAYARQRLGLPALRIRTQSPLRLLLSLTQAQRSAISDAVTANGFANASAYVRARLFLSPPPPAPKCESHDGPRTADLRLVLRDDDRSRILKQALAANCYPGTYVLQRIFDPEA